MKEISIIIISSSSCFSLEFEIVSFRSNWIRIPEEMEGNSGGGGGGGGDVELVSKTLQVEHKLFYFDLKENPRGRYLKISEKTSATRSTIIIPFNGISWFLDLFNYYVNSSEDDQDVFSKELQLDTKAISFAFPSILLYYLYCQSKNCYCQSNVFCLKHDGQGYIWTDLAIDIMLWK